MFVVGPVPMSSIVNKVVFPLARGQHHYSQELWELREPHDEVNCVPLGVVSLTAGGHIDQ
jgi:hypothetical protein